ARSLNGILGPPVALACTDKGKSGGRRSWMTRGDMSMQIIGIDVAKATFDIALPLGQGKFRTRAKRANTASGWEELLAWRRKHAPDAAVGMEATGVYHEALARHLVQAGVTVYVVNPARIKA